MPALAVPKLALRATVRALNAAGGNQSVAARNLGMSRQGLQRRIQQAHDAGIQAAPRAAIAGPDVGALERENERLRGQVERMSKAPKFAPLKITRHEGRRDIVRVIIPDSHGAYADPVAMSLFLADLKTLDPDEIVMLGDHVDCGGFLAQHHTISYIAQASYTYEDDIAACRSHLDAIQRAAPRARIHYIEGNHEARVERWCLTQTLAHQKDGEYLRRAFAPEFLLDLKGRGITYYRRGVMGTDMRIPGAVKLGKCLFVHDPGFSEPRRTLGRFGMPVVHGHDHQAHALVQPTVGAGDVGVWSFGTLAVLQQLYAHTRPTTHTHGYGIQLVAPSGQFLTVSIPLISGVSYLGRLMNGKAA